SPQAPGKGRGALGGPHEAPRRGDVLEEGTCQAIGRHAVLFDKRGRDGEPAEHRQDGHDDGNRESDHRGHQPADGGDQGESRGDDQELAGGQAEEELIGSVEVSRDAGHAPTPAAEVTTRTERRMWWWVPPTAVFSIHSGIQAISAMITRTRTRSTMVLLPEWAAAAVPSRVPPSEKKTFTPTASSRACTAGAMRHAAAARHQPPAVPS